MDGEEINYRLLRKIQQLERKSPVLTDLKNNFYINLSEYIQALNNRFEKESDSQKKTLLKDEIQNTKKIAVNIYEQREKKILLAAVSKARGGNPDLKNMLSIERELFDCILNHMKTSRSQIFENKESDKKVKLDENKTKKETENVEHKKEEENSEKSTANTNPILQTTKDIPKFVGTDEKQYTLKEHDVFSAPKDMADMLCKRDTVKKLEIL